MPHYTLATDGSCLRACTRDATGGWAAVLAGPGGITRRSGSEPGAGSAEMELRAVFEGLALVPEHAACEVVTDFPCLTGWLSRTRKHRTATIETLIGRILALADRRHVTFQAAHRHTLHQEAHRLARAAARGALAHTPTP